MSFHDTTVPVSIQIGIAKVTLKAGVMFRAVEGGPVTDAVIMTLTDPTGALWPIPRALSRWLEANVNPDDLRASIDPAFAAQRRRAAEAYVGPAPAEDSP